MTGGLPLPGSALALVLVAVALLVLPGRPPLRAERPAHRVPRWGLRHRRAVLLAAGLGAAAVVFAPEPPEIAVVAALVGAALGWWLPIRPAPDRRREQRWWLTVLLDLWAATVASGLPAGPALDSVLSVLPHAAEQPAVDALRRVGALLRVGSDADRAWAAAEHEPDLATVAQAARRSASAGTDLAAALRAQARVLRRDQVAQAQRRSARSEVLMAGPLGLCFLPAFICLGLAPVVIALLDTLTIWH